MALKCRKLAQFGFHRVVEEPSAQIRQIFDHAVKPRRLNHGDEGRTARLQAVLQVAQVFSGKTQVDQLAATPPVPAPATAPTITPGAPANRPISPPVIAPNSAPCLASTFSVSLTEICPLYS